MRVSLSQRDLEHIGAHYDGGVTYADMWLGVLTHRLLEWGLTEKTLMVVAGDHGEDLGEHGRFGHGFGLFETILHVPLVCAGPGVAASRRVTDLAGLIDLAPTALDWAGIPADHQHQGRSLTRFLRPGAPAAPEKDQAVFSCTVGAHSLRTPNRHMICFQPPDAGRLGEQLLFDPVADPKERVDFSKRRANETGPLLGRLMDWLERYQTTTDAPLTNLNAVQRERLRIFGYW